MYTVESRYAWRRLVASTAISTLGGVGMWSITVVMPAVQAEFAVTRADVSFSYTTTMIGFGLGTVGAGYLIDRLGAFLTVMLATLVLVGGYVAAAFVPMSGAQMLQTAPRLAVASTARATPRANRFTPDSRSKKPLDLIAFCGFFQSRHARRRRLCYH